MVNPSRMRDVVSIDEISRYVRQELAAIDTRREEEKKRAEAEENRSKAEEERRKEAERRAKEWAKAEPEYRALLTAISDLERGIIQLEYDIREFHRQALTNRSEAAIKTLQGMLDKRNNWKEQLQCKRRVLEELKTKCGGPPALGA